MSNPFDDFVRQQVEAKQANERSTFSKERELERWRGYLRDLYELVEAALKPYIDAGNIQISTKKIVLNEEFSGPYEVDAMAISIGSVVVNLKPIGTMLIGARGRVDMLGPRGMGRFVVVSADTQSARQLVKVTVRMQNEAQPPEPAPKSPDEIKWAWKISDLPPHVKFHDVTHESFRSLLLKCANG